MPTIELNGRTAPGLSCSPTAKETVYWSNDLPGFGLRCRLSGARSWYVQYRTKAGEMRKHTLGNPDAVPFAKARKAAEQLLAAVKLGGDPAAETTKTKGAVKVRELVASYLDHQRPRMKARSYAELERHLHKHVKALHGGAAGKVSQRQVVELLQGLAKDAPVTANRVRASLSAMFAWGMKAGLVSANPVAVTFKPAEEKPRERVLTDPEMALIWTCAGTVTDHDRIVRLLMLTGSRRQEIAGMRWSEVVVNSDGTATWVLPSERSKNHLPHELDLPRMAAELLLEPRQGESGKRRELVFGEGTGSFSGWSRCKARLDQRITKANGGTPIPDWVLHDLRRTFVTRLNDLGIEPHIIEALVNHASGSARAGVAGIYNRSAYSVQKRAALTTWCDHVVRLVGADPGHQGATRENVVPLRRAG